MGGGVVSCTTEDYDLEVSTDETISELKEINASLKDFYFDNDIQTRSAVVIDNDNNYQLVWAETDTIGIFPNQGYQVAFPMTDGAGTKTASFDGGGWGLKSSSFYSAYFPLIGQFYLDKTRIPINLSGQVQSANNSTAHLGAYDYMCAINSSVNESGSVSFNFNHLVFILHLRLTLPKAGVYTSLVLETNGVLTTEATLNLSNGEITKKRDSEFFTLSLNDIELTSDNLVLDAYMALFPVDLSDKVFKVKIFDDNNNCYEATLASRNYEAGTFYHQARTAGDNLCAGLPIIMINTPNWQDVTSKDVWLSNTSIAITNTDGSHLEAPGKIKGRGNSTWSMAAKKPYAIKFSDKQSPFGFPENKSWVLLAEYDDKTFLRTPYMCAVSRAAEIEYTINYKHVNLFLNGEYRGIYILTDKIETSKNRVQVEKDGYLIEHDSYYDKEPLYFVTDYFNCGFTFKYPDPEDGEIVLDDENYTYIKDFVNNVELSLLKLDTDENDIDYLNYLDLESFAKYYVAAMVLELEDPNNYYVLPSKNSKMKRMPMWDAGESLGLWPVSSWGEVESILTRTTWSDRRQYFLNIFKSPTFKSKVIEEWNLFKPKKQRIIDEITAITTSLSYAQQYNFSKWPDSGHAHVMNVFFDTWEEDVNYVNQFFIDRFDWFDGYISSW